MGILLSIAVGLACAVIQYEKIPVLRRVVAVYIEISRNTPLLIQLFFPYYGLPKIGIRTSPAMCGVAGLAFLGGSYMAEAFRSGLEAVEPIQRESAFSPVSYTHLDVYKRQLPACWIPCSSGRTCWPGSAETSFWSL